MATVLSRALKLPGKKSPDLGEYDPLTQADSDESEDDLVLAAPQKNGGVKNGQGPRGEAPDSDAEGPGPAPPRVPEAGVQGFPAEPPGGLEPKAAGSLASLVRTAVFLLTLLVSMVLVLLCAFLIPCPPRDLHSAWSRRLASGAGGDLAPLDLADVNGDGLRDVLLAVVRPGNGSGGGGVPGSDPSAHLLCLSGMNGSTLWSTPLPEEAQHVACVDLQPGLDGAEALCLVTGTRRALGAYSASSGEAVWTLCPKHLANGTVAAPAVLLPDLDGDGARDLLLLAVGDAQPDLCFLLVSGRTGTPLGRAVKFNGVGVGNLIGPQVYTTASGAVYVLFGFGNIQAVALRDLFVQAQSPGPLPTSLQTGEPAWERRRASNASELIPVYSDGVEQLQVVKALDANGSDLLLTTRQGLVLLGGQSLTPRWTLHLQGLHSQPTPGYFTDDQTLDFLLQISDGMGTRQMMVVDGGSGSISWNHSAPCRMKESPTSSAVTSELKSVFLFWAEALAVPSPDSGVSPGAEAPGLHHLYLLHPAFPSILLDLANTTGIVTASAVGINDVWKDAFYVTRTAEPGPEGRPRPVVVSKLSLRWALMEGRVVPLHEAAAGVGRGELRRFLSRIKFVDSAPQV
ncbi:protein FAM234B [Perognathus longimembris pacificus]|uniref:protein FAM234B n=1 Tax=Perognathus longimembris pacificus TaxID=214514 RepID=UPI0020193FC2|nr:protein FAM234B [Perognathus longimembris pacificus]